MALALLLWQGVVLGGGYEETLKPLFRERCYACHGALKQKGDLRLDTVAAMHAGQVINRQHPKESVLLQRTAAADPEERMPPPHEGEALDTAMLGLLEAWLVEGAPAPLDELPEAPPEAHWAYQPIVRPPLPEGSAASHPIDAFLEEQWRSQGLAPAGEASPETLIRRAFLDLIGLPPKESDWGAWLGEWSPQRYERLVDQLLDDPRHGERWARHWMDIWRYSDWWGLGEQRRNSQERLWHWRDWIVESLNADLPYDEMIRLMLAADELYPEDLSKLRATGFLARNFFLFNRTQWMDEVVEHVSKGFLGITMNCAKCHDHKYDPIDQRDYFRLRAFFEPYHVRQDLPPGETDLSQAGVPRVFDALLDEATYRFIRGEESQPDTSEVMVPGVPELLAFDDLAIEPVSLPTAAWQPVRRPWVLRAHERAARQALEENPDNRIRQLEWESVQARVVATRAAWKGDAIAERREAIVAERRLAVARAEEALRVAGEDADKQAKAREAVTEAKKALVKPVDDAESFTPFKGAQWVATRFLDSTKDDPALGFPSTSTGRRRALAAWITDARNPLTARVAVNHLWTRHFGKPLVRSVFDFGRKEPEPVQRKLIDWLAAELIARDWHMKPMHRLLMQSEAYRRASSSLGAEVALARDPDNALWWRREPIRLESQVVRDAVLALAGTLDNQMGGPSVPGAAQDDSHRRSLYFFHSNNDRNAFLTLFDEAAVKECYQREQSIVPQQALALSNSRLVEEALPAIVGQLGGGACSDDEFVSVAFLQLLGLAVSGDDRARSLAALQAWKGVGNSILDARAQLVWTLINHNDFVTLR